MLKALDHGRLFGREEVNPRFGVNLREARFLPLLMRRLRFRMIRMAFWLVNAICGTAFRCGRGIHKSPSRPKGKFRLIRLGLLED